MAEDEKPPGKNESHKQEDLLVYVFNAVEDEWSFISAVESQVERQKLIEDNESAADSYYLAMATESNFVYISPKKFSQEFEDYARELMRFKEGEVMVPELRTHLICEDLIRDAKTFTSLVSKAKQFKRVVLTSYCASPQIYSLIEKLNNLGIEVYAPELPNLENAWTTNFFGSKSGIRQLAQKSVAVEPDFRMPEGLICVGRRDAAKIAASRYLKNKGVVIKTNKGSGGAGVLIFRENELPLEYVECEKAIVKAMNGDRYWDEYPIVIEDLVQMNPGIAGGLPNVEYKIHKNGRIEMTFVCACKVTKKGKFYGLDISDDILNDRIQTQLEDVGYYVAEQYAAAGYRGVFDIDMMASRNGIYVVESNTRNTGGTDTYKMIKKLIGPDFMDDAYTISRSRHGWLKPAEHKFTELKALISPLLYSHKKKEGVIVGSESSIADGKVIYIVIGRNKKRAYQINQEFIEMVEDNWKTNKTPADEQ